MGTENWVVKEIYSTVYCSTHLGSISGRFRCGIYVSAALSLTPPQWIRM